MNQEQKNNIIGILENDIKERIYDLDRSEATKTVGMYFGKINTTYSQNYQFPMIAVNTGTAVLRNIALKAQKDEYNLGDLNSKNYKDFLFD